MKKTLLCAAVCIVMLPLWSSPTAGNHSPLNTVALAGHTLSGTLNGYCSGDYDNTGFCEVCGSWAMVASPDSEQLSDKGDTSNNPGIDPNSDLDIGSGALLFGLGLLLWRCVSSSI